MGNDLLYAVGIVVIALLVAAVIYRRTRQARSRLGYGANDEGAMLRTLIDNLPDLIYVKDGDGRFLLANAAVARVMGANSPKDLLGKNDFDFFSKDMASLYHEDEQAVIRSGTPLLDREEECRDPSGTLMYLRTTKIPLRDSGGTVTGLVGIGRDITLRTLQEKALDAAVRESQVVIQAVLSGAGSQRIPMGGKSGSLERLAETINQLIDGLSTTVAEAVQVVQRAVAGDLTTRMGVENKPGDLKVLALSVNSMIQAMMEVVKRLRQSSIEIQQGAEDISRGNLNLSERTEEQSAHLTQTAASMEEMTSTVTNNAENAIEANKLAAMAREQAERGGQVVGAAVAAMSEINTASKRIADIVGVINGIAFQTKLLALNAAVEAARAAEQGKGFAVVASEVRTLATRSADAAKEIESLIHDSVRKVNDGARLVHESGTVLDEIVTRVKKVTDMMGEIASASREQASGIEQVNKAVTAMDTMTQQNAGLAEQAAATARALNEQAADLTNMTSQYRLS